MAAMRKYNVQDLEIGESVLIPWIGPPISATYRRTYQSQKAINVAIWREEKKTGKKFRRVGKPYGLMVTRLA